MVCRHYYQRTDDGMLVCERCGKIRSRHRRYRRRRARRGRGRGGRMRGTAIASIMIVASAAAILVAAGGGDVFEGRISSGESPEPPRVDPDYSIESLPDSGDDALPQHPDSPIPPPEPPNEIDFGSDADSLVPPPDPGWNMSTTPGVFEAQLVKLSDRGYAKNALKMVLILDSPTELSLSIDNQSRVHSHFLLDTWHENRGLAELDGRGTDQNRGGPPLAGIVPRALQPDSKIRHVRADAPPRDSSVVESLAEAAYSKSVSLDQLYSTALDAINGHRTAAGSDPVKLSDNVAAQIHAQDVLEQLAISHYMSNGEKPYMTYSMAGGAGYVAQNVAFGGYDRPGQCGGYVRCMKIDPIADMLEHHNGMMFDDAHAEWGHRDNILDPRHTHVSIGVAYTDYTLAFVQNFERRHIEGTDSTGGSNNPISLDGRGKIKLAGSVDAGLDVHSIDVYFDPLPTIQAYKIHANDMSYDLGTPIAHIYEPNPHGYITAGETIIMADHWDTSGGSVLVEFNAPPGMSKNGAYTFYVWLTDKGRDPFIGSSKTFLVGDPVYSRVGS